MAGFRTFSIAFFLFALRANAQSQDLAAKSQQAKEAMRAGNYTSAISLYKELTNTLPDNAGLALNLGLALHSAGEYASAVQQFQRVTKAQPHNGAAWFLLGMDLQKLGRPAEAIPPLQRCLELDPGNGSARLELGDALFNVHRFSDAAAAFRLLADTDRTNPKVWLGLGLAYSSLAAEAFATLQSSFSDSVYVQMLAARSQADQHQYRSAYQLYRQALKRDPRLVEAHQAIAEIYRATGHPDWAEAEVNTARDSITPDCATRGFRCLFSQGKYADLLATSRSTMSAESLYWEAQTYRELAMSAQQTLAELPPSAELHQMMAVIFDLRELYPDAAREWRQALAIQPGNRTFKRKLALSLSGSGAWTETADIAKELLVDEPNSADLHVLLGDALLNLQQPEQAVPELKKAVLLNAGNASAQVSLGRAYLLIGDFQHAVPHLEKGLSTDRDGTLLYQLAQAYRTLGQNDKATAVLARYKNRKDTIQARKVAQEEQNQITPPADAAAASTPAREQ